MEDREDDIQPHRSSVRPRPAGQACAVVGRHQQDLVHGRAGGVLFERVERPLVVPIPPAFAVDPDQYRPKLDRQMRLRTLKRLTAMRKKESEPPPAKPARQKKAAAAKPAAKATAAKSKKR